MTQREEKRGWRLACSPRELGAFPGASITEGFCGVPGDAPGFLGYAHTPGCTSVMHLCSKRLFWEAIRWVCFRAGRLPGSPSVSQVWAGKPWSGLHSGPRWDVRTDGIKSAPTPLRCCMALGLLWWVLGWWGVLAKFYTASSRKVKLVSASCTSYQSTVRTGSQKTSSWGLMWRR